MKRTNIDQRESVARALDRIHEATSKPTGLNVNELWGEYQILGDLYDMDYLEATIIAVLWKERTAGKDALSKAISPSLGDLGEHIGMLVQSGSISTSGAENEETFSLTADFRRILEEGEAHVRPMKDCFEGLRKASRWDLANPRWLASFEAGFKLPGNESFRKTDETFGIGNYPQKSRTAFWILAGDFIRHFSKGLCEDDDSDINGLTAGDIAPLVKDGLVTVLTFEDEPARYVISPAAAGELFHGREEIVQYGGLAKCASIVPRSKIEAKELFFSAEAEEDISRLQSRISYFGFRAACAILSRKGHTPAILALIWGPPGTGKTEAVRQLALRSGRDLVVLDPAKLSNRYVGTTEKAYRRLFLEYRYVCAVSDNIPILLLNEADAILSRRVPVGQAVDKEENSVTDVILQEMEQMLGILIATTNLTDSMDSAFDRRFLLKTELGLPDEMARRKIWKANIPELSDDDTLALASLFQMSGAQINNVAVKRDMAEVFDDGDFGMPFIMDLCEKELALERKKKGCRRRIGF